MPLPIIFLIDFVYISFYSLFFKQIEAYLNTERNRLVICLTFYGGLRIGEVASLKWSDVIDNNLTVKDEIVLMAENVKGREEQRLFVNKKLRAEIINYKTYFSQNTNTLV